MTTLLLAALSFFAGAFTLLGYIIWRMLRSDGWDKSNALNALRLLSHVAAHPEDFGRMVYIEEADDPYTPESLRVELEDDHGGMMVRYFRRPFWYISRDEFEGVVGTRSMFV